ncbi:MAG TPA: pyruvate dehydrogenase (acetyl-transferring) E1 component subunit alpha [Anaerolineae bacterium]|jgi:pyruvate dehydrogenase E1 component alpha subunit
MSVITADKHELKFKVADKAHQVLTPEGDLVGPLPDLSPERLIQFYRWMVLGRVYSDRMVALQRQGRMGTFAPLNGQEAVAVGVAAPLQPDDWLVGSYRVDISYYIKGVPLVALMQQWGGTIADNYPREANAMPFQIVLGTQMQHAVGVAQALKYEHKPNVVLTTIGDGATSEGDFNEALNFAGVFKVPAIFVVNNNGWAISTPRKRQTAAEFIADRGAGFGIPSCVVDGNDVLALSQVVTEAISRARAGDGPTLIEAITYRLAAHTTADDPTKYRSREELWEWTLRDPISRFRTFLLKQGILTKADDEDLQEEVKAEIQAAVETYEALAPQRPELLFDLVYAEPSPQLRRQRAHLLQELSLN